MNIRPFLLIVFLAFTAAPAFAQEKPSNDYDGQKHITGTDYSYYKKKREAGSYRGEEKEAANVIKMSLMSWLTGDIPFYYERRVTPWLGLQAGVGLTTRDFLGDLTTLTIDAFRDNGAANYNNYAYYANEGRKSSVGFYVSFQPKFYPFKHALGGFFVSPMVEFKRYDFKAEYTDPTVVTYDEETPTFTSQTMSEYRNTVDFTVNVGRQWLLRTGVSLELMGGVGFRKNWEQRRFITQNEAYNPNTGSDGYTYTTATQWYTFYRPQFNLSLIVGGYF